MDLVAPVRVVIIDDNPIHLFSIANGLTMSGIPCVWHWYNREEGKLIPDPPKEGYPHLRLLFTDLNIREMEGAMKDAKSLASTLISEVLQPMVANDGGPYSVVLWTSVGVLSEEVKPIILERINAAHLDEAEKRPQPLSIETFEKAGFVAASANAAVEGDLSRMFNESTKNADDFKKAVQVAVSKNVQLRLVSGWESRLSLSATSTMKSIHCIAVNEAKASGTLPASAMEKLLAKIAIEAVGEQNAIDNPMMALDAGLLDLAVDELGANRNMPDFAKVVSEALGDAIKAKPSVAPSTKSQLNTHLHIELSPATREIVTRGAVFSTDAETIKELTGRDEKILLKEEFMPVGHTDDLLNTGRALLIEIGADCDHAQRKPRTIRFLCAAELQFEHLTKKQREYLRKLEWHDALVPLGPWNINGVEKVLLVSVRRFVTRQEWDRPEKLVIQYRLRKSVADLVLYKYTTHSNRPGIMSLNG